VIRRGFSHDLADVLIADLKRQLPRLERQQQPLHKGDGDTAFRH